MGYILYANGPSGNHGCEAIIRGTQAVLQGKPLVLSRDPQEDCAYEINTIAEVKDALSEKKKKRDFIAAYVWLKLTGDYVPMDGISYLDAIRKLKGKENLAISVGGDNYCYGNPGIYQYLNRAYHKNGYRTVLWGCSIEPDIVNSVANDLNLYDLIVARESITYNAIKQVCDHVVMAPDPAFFMEPVRVALPEQFYSPVIGINASPMILSYEKNDGMTYQNYHNMIRCILKETDYNIALIPHVVWETNDDRTVLDQLYDDFNQDKRIVVINDHKAPELKYIISKCDCFVGARTHATIAAYSSAVPTLVMGYSVKSRGIARDLFGTEEHYLMPVQSLSNSMQMVEELKWLLDHKDYIRSYLQEYLLEYKSGMKPVAEMVSALL
jgi:polysaccharide pyruvyl transferase WcaK-like protein